MNTKLFHRVVGSLLVGALPTAALSGTLACNCLPSGSRSETEFHELPPLVSIADLGDTDGGPADGGPPDGGPGPSYPSYDSIWRQCYELCSTRVASNGRPYSGGEPAPGVLGCNCYYSIRVGPQCYFQPGGIEGRRPAGFMPRAFLGQAALASFFARALQCEAASIAAFRILAQELRVHRAPPALIRHALRAAADEVGHAGLTQTLLARFGGRASWPQIESREPRTLIEVAVENEVEGCVGEAYSAFVAAWQTRAAADPWVRAVMAVIAPEEMGHAELAFAISRWLHTRLGRRGQEQLREARAEALQRLQTAVGTPHAAILTRVAGLPAPATAQRFLRAAAQSELSASAAR